MTRLILLVGLLACFSYSVQAAQPLSLRYAVYGGGVHVVNGVLNVSETNNSYEARVKAGTDGFLAKVAPWSSLMVSKGVSKENGWRPTLFRSTTRWRDDAKTIEMRYDGKGQIVSRVVREAGKPDDNTDADPKLVAGATDLPTGLLNFFRHRSMKQGCVGQFTVYDGKRRFKVTTANQRQETLKASRYNVFEGKAVSCTIEITPDGGRWSKKNKGWYKIQQDSRAKGGLPRVTVAALPDVADWLVPVRLDLVSPWGTFVMHLTGAQAAVK